MPTDTLRLSRGEVDFGEGATPPAQRWTPVVLPDFFLTHSPPGDRIGWYRLAFDMASAAAEPLVLLVQRVVMMAEFRLNGSQLNPGMRFAQEDGPLGTQMLNWPHWVVLPPGLFRPGHNELLIKLRSDRPTSPWISGISIGRPDALRGEFPLRDIPQRLIPRAQFVLVLAALMFGLRIWWRDRQPLQTQLLVTMLLWLLNLWWYLDSPSTWPWRAAILLFCVLWDGFQEPPDCARRERAPSPDHGYTQLK